MKLTEFMRQNRISGNLLLQALKENGIEISYSAILDSMNSKALSTTYTVETVRYGLSLILGRNVNIHEIWYDV